MTSLLIAALLQAAATASPASPPAASPEQTVVVTGRPVAETERALRDCLARGCPPAEDMQRTLAHAENQFVAGNYPAAQATLRASIRRNDRFARDYPRAVAGLHRASGRIAIHMGEGEDYRRASYAIGRSIRAGLPKDGPDSLMADLEIAETAVALRSYDRARVVYADVAARAARTNQPVIGTMVQLRQAMLHYALRRTDEARRALAPIAELQDPTQRSFRLAARVLLARMDRQDGKMESSDRLVAEMAAMPGKTPVLIYAPPIAPNAAGRTRTNASGNVLNQLAADSFDKVWADFGFWIRPDGTVADIDVLRDSGRGSPTWTRPVIASLANRRYAPFQDAAAGPDGVYRIERYSYTSLYQEVTGTRIRQHSPEGRYERVDISPDLPVTPAGSDTPAPTIGG